ncbi:unnamed protein product [Closterium sp. NIES-65]|nr:unnamed protein product [Closterium sp. NIES-65]
MMQTFHPFRTPSPLHPSHTPFLSTHSAPLLLSTHPAPLFLSHPTPCVSNKGQACQPPLSTHPGPLFPSLAQQRNGLRLRMPCIVHIATASPPRPSPPRPSHPHPSPLLLHGLSAIGPASLPTLTFNRVNAGQQDFPAIHSLPSHRLVRRCHHCLPALLPHHQNGLTAM